MDMLEYLQSAQSGARGVFQQIVQVNYDARYFLLGSSGARDIVLLNT